MDNGLKYNFGVNLESIRNLIGYSYYDIKMKGLNNTVAKKIEKENNGHINSFFKYLTILDCELIIDETPVKTLKELGEKLKELRLANNLSVTDMMVKTELSENNILRIEQGNPYFLKSLLRYVSAFDDFKFTFLIDSRS